MSNSLKCRLKKLKHQGLFSEKDLNRIIVIPNNATNGDIAKKFLPYDSYEFTENCVWCYTENFLNTRFDLDWWNAPCKLSELKGGNNEEVCN